MDPISLAVLGLFGLFGGGVFVSESLRKAAQKERIKEAYVRFGGVWQTDPRLSKIRN